MTGGPERSGDAPQIHPRDRYRLDRTEGPSSDFEHALARGRMHHDVLTHPQGCHRLLLPEVGQHYLIQTGSGKIFKSGHASSIISFGQNVE